MSNRIRWHCGAGRISSGEYYRATLLRRRACAESRAGRYNRQTIDEQPGKSESLRPSMNMSTFQIVAKLELDYFEVVAQYCHLQGVLGRCC